MRLVQIYSGDSLVYDNRLTDPKYTVLSAAMSEGVNLGGTLTITLPRNHVLYNGFPALRTPVELRVDGNIRWRGRALPSSDDYYLTRTITCEGEMCFLHDAVMRPYLYTGAPDETFRSIMAVYNAAVDSWKQFEVGQITVTDPNNYLRVEAESPESVFDVIQKLIDRLGGTVYFDTADNGKRRINWIAGLPYVSTQKIEFSRNLMDYGDSGSAEGLATRIIPFGAVMEDGRRLKINVDGHDYVENEEAIALRGVIEKAMVYDNITTEAGLLSRATQDVNRAGLLPRRISISAVDLSTADLSVSGFRAGQTVICESAPHGLSGRYALRELSMDWIRPDAGQITLTAENETLKGNDSGTISGALAAGDKANGTAIAESNTKIQHDYKTNIAETKQNLTTQINQTAHEVVISALEDYATIDSVEQLEAKQADLAVKAGEVDIRLRTVEKDGIELDNGFAFTSHGMIVDQSGAPTSSTLTHDGLTVERNGETMLSANSSGCHGRNLTADNYLIFGEHARCEKYMDGSTARVGCFWI